MNIRTIVSKRGAAAVNNQCRAVLSLMSVLCLFLCACAHSDGSYKGRVIELDTGKPIEGAVVAADWTIETGPHMERVCAVEETLTDKSGEFELPAISCAGNPFAKLQKPWVVVFKPGYLGYPPLGASPEERKAHMPGLTGREFVDENQYSIIRLGRPTTRQERALTVDHAEVLLHDANALRKLPNLLKLTNEENRALGFGERRSPSTKDGRQ